MVRPFHVLSLELADVWHRYISSFVGGAQDRRIPFVIAIRVLSCAISSTGFQSGHIGFKIILVIEIPISRRRLLIVKLELWLNVFEVDRDIRSFGHFWCAFIVQVLTLAVLL